MVHYISTPASGKRAEANSFNNAAELKYSSDDSQEKEIQDPPKRYGIIDIPALMTLLGVTHVAELQGLHNDWVEAALKTEPSNRERRNCPP